MRGKEIIKYGKKVNKLFFLLKGDLIAYNKENKPIYLLNKSTIFGDWEFLNDSLSDVSIKVVKYKPAIGFSLDKKIFRLIAKEYIESAKYFFVLSLNKKLDHYEWIYGNKLKIDKVNDKDKNGKEINKNKLEEIEKKLQIINKNVSSLELGLINFKDLIITKING